MAFHAERPPEVAAVRPHGLRTLLRAYARHRLARRVREHALGERRRRQQAGVVEFDSIGRRTALYEQIALRLEKADSIVPIASVQRLRSLLAEPAPLRDYGKEALTRDARIASILADLSPERELRD